MSIQVLSTPLSDRIFLNFSGGYRSRDNSSCLHLIFAEQEFSNLPYKGFISLLGGQFLKILTDYGLEQNVVCWPCIFREPKLVWEISPRVPNRGGLFTRHNGTISASETPSIPPLCHSFPLKIELTTHILRRIKPSQPQPSLLAHEHRLQRSFEIPGNVPEGRCSNPEQQVHQAANPFALEWENRYTRDLCDYSQKVLRKSLVHGNNEEVTGARGKG